MKDLIIINKKLLSRVAAVVAAALLLMSAVPFKAAADTGESKKVRVGYYENEVFQEGAGEGKVKSGYAYEYYLKLSEYTGWQYEYVYGDFTDMYEMLLNGDIDFLAGLAWKEDRADIIGYPDSPMGNESYNLVKHDSDEAVTSDPATLKGKKIGILDGAMVDVLKDFLDAHSVDAEIVTFGDYESLFSAFDEKSVDILAAESDGAYSRKHAEILYIFGSSDYYLCVSKNRKDLLKELNQAQNELNVDEPNYINSLRIKYYPISISSRAFSKAEKEWLDNNDSLRVGYLNNYLPYSGTDESGEVTGLVKDLIPRMLEELNTSDIEVTYHGYDSYDDMISDMNADVTDLAFPVGGGLFYAEESGIFQSNPVVSSATEFVFSGEYNEEKTSHFAINENNRMQYYYVKANFPDAEITMYNSIDECLEAVSEGKAGGTTLNGLRANDILRNSKYDNLSLLQLTENDDRCFGVSIGNEGLLRLLNRGLNMVGDEYAQNLAYRYSDLLYSYTTMDFIRNHMVVIGSIVLALAALIIAFLMRDSKRSRREIEEREASQKQLEQKNAELAESREALREALDDAEQASRAKTVFLNNMSHDIRTPMNAIVGFTSLAASEVDNKDRVLDYLDKISSSSQHLLSLINDVLDMSRIESGNVTIHESEVNIPKLIRGLEAIVQNDAESKHQHLTINIDGIVNENVEADRLRLNQILLNILSNAVKFTPEGGEISFITHEMPCDKEGFASYEFRIKDNGIGMSDSFRETIFESFTRERTSTVSGIQGTGLGMAITKSLIDMMGGSIEVESAEGDGSEFIVRLSFRIAEEAAGSSGGDAVTDGDAEKADVGYDFKGRKALLAEDNALNQQIAKVILEQAGFTVEIASDGTEAVRIMDKAAPGEYDVIMMDIQMPHMDGYEAARRIRALEDKEKADIPIIAVTANAFEEDRKAAIENGMNGHLAKPYEIPEMMKTLNEILH